MAQSINCRKTGRSVDFRGLLGQTVERLSDMVCHEGMGPALRRRNGRLATGLIAGGFALVVLSPLALLAPGAALALPVILGLSVVLLGFAAALAAGGDLDLVLAGMHLLGSIVLGALALSLDSFWLLGLVAVAPIEAWVVGARVRAKMMVPAVMAAIGLTGFLSLHGMGPSGQGVAGHAIAIPFYAAYAVFVACRTYFGSRPSTVPRGGGDEAFAVLTADGHLADSAREPFLPHVHLLDHVALLRAMDGMRSGGPGMELRLRLRDGGDGYRPMEIRLEPIRDAGGELLRVRVLANGRLALPAMAEALPESRQTEFLATVSHELRTPLNAIVGFADMLDQNLCGHLSDPRQKEYVGLIRRSSEHLLGVVNGLLDVSKIEAGRYELHVDAFQPAEVARAAAEMVQGEADRKGLRLTVRGGDPADTMIADRHACCQILVNLLSNAVKFTDRGTVCLTLAQDPDWLTITVSDTGIGIEEADLNRLARPFVQVSQGPSRRYGGTGLGLSLVKGLAELHHGSFQIRSQPGRGTTVTVRIPTDCAARIEAGRTHSENIVALTDARKKTSLFRQDPQDRRTA